MEASSRSLWDAGEEPGLRLKRGVPVMETRGFDPLTPCVQIRCTSLGPVLLSA